MAHPYRKIGEEPPPEGYGGGGGGFLIFDDTWYTMGVPFQEDEFETGFPASGKIRESQIFCADPPYRRMGFENPKWHTRIEKSGKSPHPKGTGEGGGFYDRMSLTSRMPVH